MQSGILPSAYIYVTILKARLCKSDFGVAQDIDTRICRWRNRFWIKLWGLEFMILGFGQLEQMVQVN